MKLATLLSLAMAGGILFSSCGGGVDESASPEARRWLDLKIERPEIEEPEKPEFVEDQIGEVENGLLTNIYFVRPSFLASAPRRDDGGGAAPDPFAVPTEPIVHPRTIPVRMVLEAYGVEFGPGASAIYRKKDRTMKVTQTLEQMDLVEAIISSLIGTGPGDSGTVTVRFEIFELPTSQAVTLERSADEHYEHLPELNAVLDLVKGGQAELVTTANLLSRSGQRTVYRDGAEIPVFGNFEIAEEAAEPAMRKRFPRHFVGTVIEADPVMGPDSRTLDLHFEIEHHIPIPPDSETGPAKGRYLIRTMKSTETLLSGTVKLLGSWPASESGGDDPPRSRIVFLKAIAVASMLR